MKEYELVQTSYNEYSKLNDVQMFRRLMKGKGTKACLEDAKRRDLTKVSSILDSFPFVWMMLVIVEVRDKYDGAMSDNVFGQLKRCLDDIVDCPRESV